MRDIVKSLKEYYKNNKSFCIAIFAVGIILLFILSAFNFKGHDYPFHIQRIGSIAEEIKSKGLGTFPIRIYTTNLSGYGYGTPMFYGDIFLYPFALLTVLGLNAVYSYRIMLIFVYAACALSMFYCIYKISEDTNAAIIGTLTYSLSSYFALDVLTRSAVGEFFAFIFLPLVIYGFYCIVINRKAPVRHRFFLVLGMAGLLLSHLISTVLVAICLVILMIVYYKKWVKNWGIIAELAIHVLLTVCISAFFLFPLLEQLASEKFYSTAETLYNLDGWKLRWASWIGPHAFWKLQGGRFPKLRDSLWFPGGFGLMVITLLGIWICNLKKLKKHFFVILLIASVLLIFIAQGIIIPVNWLQKVFGFMQFPYRIMILCTPLMSVFAAYAVYELKNKKIEWLLLLVSVISCALIVVTSYRIIHLERPEMTSEYNLTDAEIGNGEYIPENLVKSMNNTRFASYIHDRGSIVESNHKNVSMNFNNDGHGTIEVEFSGNSYDDTYYEVPLLYYKGYSAVDKETKEKYDVSISDNGFVKVEVGNKGSGCFIVRYTGTVLQHISDIISILTIIFLIIYFIKPEWLKNKVKKILKYVKNHFLSRRKASVDGN